MTNKKSKNHKNNKKKTCNSMGVSTTEGNRTTCHSPTTATSYHLLHDPPTPTQPASCPITS